MTRLRERSPCGQRCAASVSHGHWKFTTFVVVLRCNAVTASMVVDGPMNGALFLEYVQKFLCSTLRTGG
ncbi:MAG: hypothetical protein FWC18_00905 [Cystobacterineae bacterium]|nr:hypothetical protein [Cystobacterineae bacterium]MCL2258376.1 hypothetical protein [Cystobacterineae bacterium]